MDEQRFPVSVAVSPPETGEVRGLPLFSPDKYFDSFPAGSIVTITAVPAHSYIFAGWQEEDVAHPSSTNLTLTVDRIRVIRAVFTQRVVAKSAIAAKSAAPSQTVFRAFRDFYSQKRALPLSYRTENIVVTDGEGYVQNEILQICGGETDRPTLIRILQASESGCVQEAALLFKGTYTVKPAVPMNAVSLNGRGRNAKIDVKWSTC